MGAGRPELFPPDPGLQARMVVAVTLAALVCLFSVALLLAAAGALALQGGRDGLYGGLLIVGMPLGLLLGGWFAARRWNTQVPGGAREPDAADADRLKIAVERLCLVADVEPPETKVVPDVLPLSWTSAPPGRAPRVHVTTALLDALPERELSAALGHELSHIVHRDAVVMTVVGGPSVYVLRGVRQMISEDPFRGSMMAVCGLYFIAPAMVLVVLARVVSRHRVLAADRSAALLVGSPAALASALVRIREYMIGGKVLLVDLKTAAPRNHFHVLPAEKREPRGLRRLWASHPRMEDRLAQLDEMEETLQRTRGPGELILEEPRPQPPRSRSAAASGGSSRAARGG